MRRSLKHAGEMSYRFPAHNLQGVDYGEIANVQDLHAAVAREKCEARAGLQPLSIWILALYAVTLFLGGFYLARYSGEFSGASLDPRTQEQSATISQPSEKMAQLAGAARADSNISARDQAAGAKPGEPAVVQIVMRNMKFNPPSIEVKKGDIVEWKNDDITPHTATSASFDSASIDPDQSWRHTFTETGNFPYNCTFHPDMKATVVVK
jgi:plastocyanin